MAIPPTQKIRKKGLFMMKKGMPLSPVQREFVLRTYLKTGAPATEIVTYTSMSLRSVQRIIQSLKNQEYEK